MIIDNLKDFSEKELQEKIDDLTKKYFIANSNPDLQMQIANALDILRIELEDRTIQRNKAQFSDNKDLDNLININ